MHYLTIASLALLTACQTFTAINEGEAETVRVGLELEARCQQTRDIDDCAAFQSFKSDFERSGVLWDTAYKGW